MKDQAYFFRIPVPEFIDPVFTKTSSFSVIENERFGLVFEKAESLNSGTEELKPIVIQIRDTTLFLSFLKYYQNRTINL